MSKQITFQLNKLVRESYYQDMLSAAITVKAQALEGDEKRRKLIAKVREELAELESGDDENPTDVGSALFALAGTYGFSSEEFFGAVQLKDLKAGGFGGGWYVDSLTFEENNKWVEYYRKDPEKYPETAEEV